MIEAWIEELGGTVTDSIHDPASVGGRKFGYATAPGVRLRYSWERLDVARWTTFDRWANSVDWTGPLPESREELETVLRDVAMTGNSGVEDR